MARAARHIASFVRAVAVLPVVLSEHAEAQTGESVIAWHVTIAPSWFDPSTAPAQITPFGILYALHDSVVRATYGSKIGPGLAEAWSESPDGLTYEFRLRRWRKVSNVKRFVMKSVPEGTTRVAMLKNGEADIAYALDGEDALNVRRDSRLALIPSKHASIYWIEFADQWDPKSVWHDKRVRQAAILAIDRPAVNEVSCLGFCPPTSIIIPRVMDFALQTPAAPYDPEKAKKLLAEAGYPNGFDAGDFVPMPPFMTTGEACVHLLAAVGIRTKIRPTERAAFLTNWREKKLHGIFMPAVGNSGNAASRVGEFIYSKGTYAYGGYPDIDELFLQQSKERDVAKREAILHKIQQLTIDRAMFLPIMDYRTLRGVGPRVADHALDGMPLNPFPIYEDIKLKN